MSRMQKCTMVGLLATGIMASTTMAAHAQLRSEAGSVHPQSMAASYGSKSTNDGSSTLAFGHREIKVEATAQYNSEYVFRGAQLAKHNAQGGVELSSGGFYAGGWVIIPTEDNFNAYQTEIDLYGGYGFDLTGNVYADVGVNGYLYNSPQLLFAAEDSVEVYAGLALNSPLSPSLYGFYDFETEFATIEASLEYTLPLGQTDLVVGSTIGYTDGKGDEYAYFQADAEVVYNLNRQAALGVGAHWAVSEDSRFLRGLALNDSNSTWYGITLKARN